MTMHAQHAKRSFAARHFKRFTAVAAAVAVGFGTLLAGGTAEAASASNYAYSHATAGHHSSFDVAFQVRQEFSHSINAYNDADASSSNCTGCRSIAIAFQIVADGRVPSYVNAGNEADAVNINCTYCQTLGVAYQFVVAKPLVLTWNDRAKLWGIDMQLWSLRWSYAPTGTVAAQVQKLADETAQILANAGHGYWPLVHRYLTWKH